jgi:hypothetical protein
MAHLVTESCADGPEFRFQKPDVATHHVEMGNLLPLNPNIHRLRADAKEDRFEGEALGIHTLLWLCMAYSDLFQIDPSRRCTMVQAQSCNHFGRNHFQVPITDKIVLDIEAQHSRPVPRSISKVVGRLASVPPFWHPGRGVRLIAKPPFGRIAT